MNMFNKHKNYSVLKDVFKIPQSHLDTLKNAEVDFKMGTTAIALDNNQGLAKELSFNTLVNNIMKTPHPEHIVAASAFVATYVNVLSQSIVKSSPVEKVVPKPVKAVVTQADIDAMSIVQLRDATTLYQRVHGTSAGAIYRVVALNDKIKVAAKIKGNAVSLRIEGVFSSSDVTTFNALGISKKTDEYMSGHFSCEKCTPQKLIGSVLVGSGISFTSPIPVITSKIFA